MSKQRILVIEERRSGREAITPLLTLGGLKADGVDTAEKALELLKSGQYMLCMIDLTLPTMQGWQLLRTLRYSAEFANFPCVAIMPHFDIWVRQKSLQAGFTSYIPKLPLTSLVPQVKEIVQMYTC